MNKNTNNTIVATSFPSKEISLNGINYHVIDAGAGDNVVLLLHGQPDTASVWRYQIDALVKAGYRVIAPDMIGYGQTDKPQETARYQGELIIGDMVALLDALELKQVDVIGHDWGAFVSWELVLNLPERFRRHVAVSVGHPDRMMSMSGPEEVKESWYMYLNGQPDTASLYAAKDGEFFKHFIIPTHPEIDEVWSRMQNPSALNGMLNWDRANQMSSFYLAMVSGESEPRKGQVPTLGIWSSGDTYLWEDQIKTSGALMDADWRYERIEGGSHWVMLDRAQEVNALILDWLENN
ncbi:alpha/beta hydrolase [uncultured Zhongshania sp.]|uniref:alpha/beta fold hydrolase n=1 Tax=uncultured Zhongshania sp. TaxID=1642288 RepID=UPI0030DA8817|tara:strand:+ start:2216 stop:3097 length:882 start_codon:yes stop_codon:yes gene_type:complete